MTESITTPNALVQTTNGKRFYVNSGLIAVGSSEVTIIDIANIGERDIVITVSPAIGNDSNDKMFMYIYNNDLLIYNYCNPRGEWTGSPLRFIIPANTSLKFTMKNIDATSHNVGISCYGKYLSID